MNKPNEIHYHSQFDACLNGEHHRSALPFDAGELPLRSAWKKLTGLPPFSTMLREFADSGLAFTVVGNARRSLT